MKEYQNTLRSMFLTLILAVFITSCLSSKPVQEDFEGLWGEYPSRNDGACGLFEFFGNGEFEAKNIPRRYFIPDGKQSLERFDTHGTWKLDLSEDDPFAIHRIVLFFAPIEGYTLGYERILLISVGGDFLISGTDDTIRLKKGHNCE